MALDPRNCDGISKDLAGDLLVTDREAKKVFRVDPVSGAQTLESEGGSFDKPRGIAVDSEGNYLVCDPGAGSVFSIDPGADPASNQAVWVGGAVANLSEEPTVELAKQRLDYAVTQMFKKLPRR